MLDSIVIRYATVTKTRFVNKIKYLANNQYLERCLNRMISLIDLEQTLNDVFNILHDFDDSLVIPSGSVQDLLKNLFYDKSTKNLLIEIFIYYYIFRYEQKQKSSINYKEYLENTLLSTAHLYFYRLGASNKLHEHNPFRQIIDNYNMPHAKFMIELLTDAILDHYDNNIKDFNRLITFDNQTPLEHLIKYNLFKWTDYFVKISIGFQVNDNVDLLRIHVKTVINRPVQLYQFLLTLPMNATNRKLMNIITPHLNLADLILAFMIYVTFLIYRKLLSYIPKIYD